MRPPQIKVQAFLASMPMFSDMNSQELAASGLIEVNGRSVRIPSLERLRVAQ